MQIKKKTLSTFMYILTGVFLFVALILVISSKAGNSGANNSGNNAAAVHMEDGKQVIEITAKGGFKPSNITAKSGTPTIIRMKTSSTFDCSSYIVISAIGVRESLPASGSRDYQVPAQASGSTINGSCGMGMYSFKINFT
jgi:plastocyanin domain-containing protein